MKVFQPLSEELAFRQPDSS